MPKQVLELHRSELHIVCRRIAILSLQSITCTHICTPFARRLSQVASVAMVLPNTFVF